MTDVYISYSSIDRERVAPLVRAIESRGWSVLWEHELEPGAKFKNRLQEEIDQTRCVVVVWSSRSAEAEWVLEEADLALSGRILLPVMIEPVRLPLPFAKLQAVELYDWKGGPHPGVDRVLAWIENIIGEPAPATPPGKRKTTKKTAEKKTQVRAEERRDGKTSEKAASEPAPDAVVARARQDFTRFLNNKDKQRNKGFIALVHGGPDLTPLEEACFDPDQRWNRCLTVRYALTGKAGGTALLRLYRAFLDDLRTLAGGGPPLGRMQPDESSHQEYAKRVTDKSSSAEPILHQAVRALSVLNELIQTGERLVLFGEFSDLGDAVSMEDLGITEEVLKTLADFPERICLVLSGIPDTIVAPGPEGPSLAVPLPDTGPLFLALQLDSIPIREIDTHAQAFANDIPGGPDRLRIVQEVNAIAETIALKKMRPPLVVGILGGWGWGKSFVLHLLEERLRDIRCETVPQAGNGEAGGEESDEPFPYVGHLYVIRFDAWTYSKSSLWASLMQTILLEFNRQLGIEQTIQGYKEDEPQVWRLLMELGHRQVEEIRESPLRDKAIQAAVKFRKGDQEIKGLWERFERLRENERLKLEESEAELASKQSELERAKEALEGRVDSELDRKIKKLAWQPIWEELLELVKGAVDEGLKAEGAEKPSLESAKKILGLPRRLKIGLNLQTACFAGFAIVSGLSPLILNLDEARKGIGWLVAALSAFGSAFGGVLQVARTSQAWLEKKFEAYQARARELRSGAEEQRDAIRERLLAEQAEAYRKALLRASRTAGGTAPQDEKRPGDTPPPPKPVTALEQDVRALEAEVAEHRRNVGITAKYSSLLDFVKGRIDSGYYDEKLGLLHQVQRDLQDLTDAILAEQNGRDRLFPRGEPRIVLIVDDLDRCPPQRVVEVLEAAQLLVKTRLFVIVMALDVRYITRALEKEYRHVLVRHGEPSGLDYIEKIIQVPYRVRAIQDDAMTGYLRPQMDIVTRRKLETPPAVISDPDMRTTPHPDDDPGKPPTVSGTDGKAPQPARRDEDAQNGVANGFRVQAVPKTIVKFLEHEPGLLADCCNKVIVSPRATKRLINVFKLLKIIWNRRKLEHGPPDDVKRVMLMLLTLSARHPEVLRVLLGDLAEEYRKAQPKVEQISVFLVQRCKAEQKTAIRPGEWNRVRELIAEDSVFPGKVTFTDVGIENTRLIISFSLVGETDPERELALQRTAFGEGDS